MYSEVIHDIAFGGEGVARIDGLVCFVPFTLPSEQIQIKIVQKKKNFSRGIALKILSPHPKRVEPPCRYFYECGGCQLQHADYSLQLEIKRKFVEDALSRIGKISCVVPPVLGTKDPYTYRKHISLTINDCGELGFTSIDNQFLSISTCLLFSNDEILTEIQLILPKQAGRLKLFKNDTGYFSFFSYLKPVSNLLLDALPPQMSGALIKTPTQILQKGNQDLSFTCLNHTFFYSPESFIQNNSEQSAHILTWILNSTTECNRVLDFYCGIGTSSILLAKAGKEVLGIESNSQAVEMAIKNAEGISNIKFLVAKTEQTPLKTIESFEPDCIIVNPPKTGLSTDVLKTLTEVSCKKILYISCNPTTLARDLLTLKNNFEITKINCFDMFPQTTHVETAIEMKKP